MLSCPHRIEVYSKEYMERQQALVPVTDHGNQEMDQTLISQRPDDLAEILRTNKNQVENLLQLAKMHAASSI